MKGIRLLTVGRPRDAWWADPVREYGRRLAPWARFEWRWVEFVGDPVREGRALRSLLDARDRARRQLVALAVDGELLNTSQLADRLQRWLDGPWQGLDLMVGGADGLDPALVADADWRWSLSPLTLAHGVATLVAAEQLYRCLAWIRGHPYHGGHGAH